MNDLPLLVIILRVCQKHTSEHHTLKQAHELTPSRLLHSILLSVLRGFITSVINLPEWAF